LEIIKRDGKIVPFNKKKIIKAVENAMRETLKGIDNEISEYVSEQVEEILEGHQNITVEDVQDLVETLLMETPRKDVAKRYILYRNERNKTRHLRDNKNYLLTEEFLSQYKHRPNPMNQLGTFTYYRTYSRWLPENKRRENWWETVRRVVEYNCALTNTSREEAEKLYDNVFNLKQFLSGRSFWLGGTKVSEKYPLGNFNCAAIVIENIESIRDLFYLLMLGTGVGMRILLHSDAKKLPKFKTNLKIIHQDYIPYPKNKRIDYTSLHFISNDTAELIIGDSKEGWSDSLYHYLNICSNKMYRNIDKLIINYNHVRGKGEKLQTFGGTASGHESVKKMFYKIDKIINKQIEAEYIRLQPIDIIDICNAIGENVVVGGVRRTSQIV
jgi:adenosylcobalamin-dependent ribonucleoside-triphosphate reductase